MNHNCYGLTFQKEVKTDLCLSLPGEERFGSQAAVCQLDFWSHCGVSAAVPIHGLQLPVEANS